MPLLAVQDEVAAVLPVNLLDLLAELLLQPLDLATGLAQLVLAPPPAVLRPSFLLRSSAVSGWGASRGPWSSRSSCFDISRPPSAAPRGARAPSCSRASAPRCARVRARRPCRTCSPAARRGP